MKRVFFVLLVLLVAASFAFAAGAKESGITQITWQVWISPNYTRPYYEKIVSAFEKKYPDIKVKIVEALTTNESNADNFIKTRLAAGDVPDYWFNTSIPVFADAGLLWALPTDDPELKRVENLMGAAYKGKLYAPKTMMQLWGVVYYNKKLWAQAGLTDTPKSWAEFDAACAKLQSAGITPILAGGEWVAGADFATFTGPEIFRKNNKWYTDRWAGKVHFTDADWVEAASWFNGLASKGYFNKGAASLDYSSLEQKFLDGEGAMYVMGSWFTAAEAKSTKDFEVGAFYSPTKDGSLHRMQEAGFGDGGCIYAKSKHPEAAWKLMKFVLFDPVIAPLALKMDGFFSAMTPPLTYEMSPLQKEILGLIPQAKTVSSCYQMLIGDMPATGIEAVYDKIGQTILVGGVTDVKPLLQQLDDFWNKAQR
jgi:ABC-type glycerol-3-phosphate transport system substrate-binding protein